MSEFISTIGRNEVRKDSIQKVRGEPVYAADKEIPGLLYAKVLRSPHHAAKIKSISCGEARKIKGVFAILTADDVPGCKTFGSIIQDQPALAFDIVHMLGEPVALVVADTFETAEKALTNIQVDYQPLGAVFDPVDALKPGAPLVHPGGNLAASYDVSDGDVDSGLAKSDIQLEETFYTPRVAPGYLETENSTAIWDEVNQVVRVWVSSQHPFEDQQQIAQVLDLPTERVCVLSAMIGGAFGGKEDSSIAILTALAAYTTKRPVRMINNRSESFLGHPKRHPAQIHIKLGAMNNGELVALKAIVHMDTGAFASLGPAVGGLLTELIPGAYRIPNVHVQTNVVYTNSPFSGAMRGFGSPQAHFPIESMMDMLASRLGINPVEIRRKNILRIGDKTYTRVPVTQSANSLGECLAQVERTVAQYRSIQPAPGKVNGVGMALAEQTMGVGAGIPDDSTHRLEWLPDGKVKIYLGAPDLGQGLSVAAEMITAEALGLSASQVIAYPVDTSITPKGGTTCASRMTFQVGNALVQASEKLVSQLIDSASKILGVPRENLSYNHGMIRVSDGQMLPVGEFTSRFAESGLRLVSEATASFPYPPETTPQHLPPGMPHVMFCYGAQVVRVEVDPELGTVDVKDVTAIHDVGKIITRQGVEGQIEGGVLMGIGYALYEDMSLKTNQRWVDSFSEYLMPTAKDTPMNLTTIILENPEPTGPYGVKGIGEITLVPTAPAIANAIFDAVGKRVTRLPIRAEDIIK